MQEKTPLTAYRQELVGKIMEVAIEEFKKFGIRSVKMDDIARKLSISKRTLYELFSDKESLLVECLRSGQTEFHNHIEDFRLKNDDNVIKIVIEAFRYEFSQSHDVNPLFYSDLHKYSKVLEYLQQKHRDNRKNVEMFFLKGVEQGYFRSEVNYELAIQVTHLAMSEVMSQQMYKEYDMMDIYQSVILVVIRGFCTRKGLDMLERGFKTENEE